MKNVLQLYDGVTYITDPQAVVDLSPGQTGTNSKVPFEYLSGAQAVVEVYPASDGTLSGNIVKVTTTVVSNIGTNYTTLAAFGTKLVEKAVITIPQYLSIIHATTAGHTTGSISVYLEA